MCQSGGCIEHVTVWCSCCCLYDSCAGRLVFFAVPAEEYGDVEWRVSQARALGAVGVLPKTVKHADVSRVLYQLRLLPERRARRPAAPRRFWVWVGLCSAPAPPRR